MIPARKDMGAGDASNGYEAVAPEFMRRREPSRIGVATVRTWARSLPRHATVLDLGCGSGVPISEALHDAGLAIYGIEASPTLAAEFRRRFPNAQLACEAVEESRFFDRRFDAAIAVGLLFLLPAEVQRATIRRVALALNADGRFLFTAPAQRGTWADVLTNRESLSLGTEEYKAVLSDAGLTLAAEHDDEGGNHYYDTRS